MNFGVGRNQHERELERYLPLHYDVISRGSIRRCFNEASSFKKRVRLEKRPKGRNDL